MPELGRPFIHEDFLLPNAAARRLFHEYAEGMPIIDYHCHLSPKQVAEDHRFATMTEIWLYGDHYKWRAMRSNGVAERYCTGDAGDWEKFLAWAQTVPCTLRNPLYHWTHLELAKPFGIIDRLLNEQTAKGIYDECNAKLALSDFSCRGIMKQFDVRLICTTDDPVDSLEYHRAVAADKSFNIQMLPCFRPDKAMAVESAAAFNAYVDKLSAAANVDIGGKSGTKSFRSFLQALRQRHDFFHQMGCRLSDHGVETAYADDYTESEIEAIFDAIRGGTELSPSERAKFKSCMLHEFGLMDAGKGWTQQYHIGPLRNNNTRMFQALGPDIGFDSIGDLPVAAALAKMFDRLERQNALAKTILYNINPRDNELLAAMIGNFQDGSIPGKMQFGSSWWFMDNLDGMTRQINALSNLGLLSRFVGMLTDSRSFLSYTRHEYFRRLLCSILGSEMEAGLVPNDFELVGNMVRDISYNNAACYFGFNLPQN